MRLGLVTSGWIWFALSGLTRLTTTRLKTTRKRSGGGARSLLSPRSPSSSQFPVTSGESSKSKAIKLLAYWDCIYHFSFFRLDNFVSASAFRSLPQLQLQLPSRPSSSSSSSLPVKNESGSLISTNSKNYLSRKARVRILLKINTNKPLAQDSREIKLKLLSLSLFSALFSV